jgi:hypothetical protein
MGLRLILVQFAAIAGLAIALLVACGGGSSSSGDGRAFIDASGGMVSFDDGAIVLDTAGGAQPPHRYPDQRRVD